MLFVGFGLIPMLNGPSAAGEPGQQGGPEADQGSEHPAPQYGSCLSRDLLKQ
jgi:hypothetical protein